MLPPLKLGSVSATDRSLILIVPTSDTTNPDDRWVVRVVSRHMIVIEPGVVLVFIMCLIFEEGVVVVRVHEP